MSSVPDRLPLLTGRFLDTVDSLVEKRKTWVVLGFSAVFLVVCGLLSATKLMWFDEMLTYYPAKLPTISGLISFFWEGLDVHTPTASLLLRANMTLFGDNPVANRIPVILGYLVMCVCVFVFVARRCPAVYAAAAMIFPALTSVFYYATEIRCYGILLGFTGIALICWQQAAEGRWRALSIAGLFLALAAAICCHYYAAVLWIPFGLAELTRTWQRKRVDVPVWLALLLSPLIVLIFVPAIRAAGSAYTATMWSKPHLGQIEESYREILTLAFAPILGGVILWMFLAPRFARPATGQWTRPPMPERVLAGSLALLPCFAVPLSYLAGAYVTRYALPTVAGLAIFFSFALCRALKGDRLAGAALLLVFAFWFVLKSEGSVRRQMAENGGLRTPLAQPFQTTSWMRALESNSLPIAATPAVFFMKLQQYAPDSVRSRVVYPADEHLALRYEGVSTGDVSLLRYRRRLPLRVPPFEEFLAQNPRFLVCAETTNPTWHLRALLDAGAQLDLVTRSGTYMVFEVTQRPH